MDEEPELFFGALGNDERLGQIADLLPPNAPFDADTCPTTLTSAYRTLPFGPYIEAVRRGLINFDQDAAETCLEELESVGCGSDFSEVFFSGRCFGFSPPIGVDRVVFQRMGQVGEPCTGIPDGYAGGFYGTCDTNVSWCATVSESGGKNVTPLGQMGTCVPTATEGQPCGFMVVGGFTVEVCTRGLECTFDPETSRDSCQQVSRPAIEVGQPCYENGLLGYCDDGWCDMFGSRMCEPHLAAGESCEVTAQEACRTGVCKDNICSDRLFCGGRN